MLASRSEQRAVLPDCSGVISSGATDAGGAVPPEALCEQWDGESRAATAGAPPSTSAEGVPDGGERCAWMREHAPAVGWDDPAWARPGGSGPTEPWHRELVEEVAAPEAATGPAAPAPSVG